jgi:ribose-phosphate pyrophosphokinase
MIDTAGTTTQAAQALKDNGAKRVFAACSHAVLSGPAIERINNSVLEEVITTDTISLDDKVSVCKKLRVLSVSSLLAEAIKRIHEETSVSSLFV